MNFIDGASLRGEKKRSQAPIRHIFRLQYYQKYRIFQVFSLYKQICLYHMGASQTFFRLRSTGCLMVKNEAETLGPHPQGIIWPLPILEISNIPAHPFCQLLFFKKFPILAEAIVCVVGAVQASQRRFAPVRDPVALRPKKVWLAPIRHRHIGL